MKIKEKFETALCRLQDSVKAYAAKHGFRDEEIKQRCILKLGEFFREKRSSDFDSSKYEVLPVVWDVVDILDWYEQKTGAQNYLDAAKSLFEAAKEEVFAESDRADFMVFIDRCICATEKSGYRPDGSVPGFIMSEDALSQGSITYHKIPIM